MSLVALLHLPCSTSDKSSISAPGSSVDEVLRAWMEQADKLENGEISKDEYNEWRYKYPKLDTYQNVPRYHLRN